MKKRGFTLAEILITLGIIGIVAALTAPSLVNRAGGAKVGPALAKAVATIENANQQMMLDEGISNLDKDFNNFQKYCEAISKYINKGACLSLSKAGYISIYNNPNAFQRYYYVLTMPGGSSVLVDIRWFVNSGNASYVPNFNIDINGETTGPNTYGKDVFMFYLLPNGALLPYGSDAWCAKLYGSDLSTCSASWRSDTNGCNDSTVDRYGYSCAGSIFDNDLKVIYE